MIKTAVIMAAGMGTRFGKYTEQIPKGFVEVCGKPMIERSIETLISCGIERIVIGTGYKHEVYDFLKKKYPMIETCFSPLYAETNSMYTLYNTQGLIGSDDFYIIGLVTSSNDYKTYVWILSITVFINYFISYLYVKKKLPIESVQVDWNFIKKIIFALFLILLLNNTNLLYTLLDRFMLGLKSDIYVAYYGVGQKLSDMLKAFLTIVVVVTIPRMSLQLNQNKERYLENINHLISFLFLLTLPIASLFFCLSKEIVILFAGENYLEAIPSLKIFAIRIVVIVLEAVLYNQIIFLYRREKDLLKLNALCGCLNLGLNGVLYSFLNPFLAILTTLVSELVFQILCIYYIRTKIGLYITYAKKSHLLYLLLSILFPLWIYVIHLFFTSAFVVIFFSCFLSLITYIIGLYLFKDKMFLLACEKIKDSIC